MAHRPPQCESARPRRSRPEIDACVQNPEGGTPRETLCEKYRATCARSARVTAASCLGRRDLEVGHEVGLWVSEVGARVREGDGLNPEVDVVFTNWRGP